MAHLQHLPRWIPRANGACLSGNIEVGRAAKRCFCVYTPHRLPWRKADAETSMEAQAHTSQDVPLHERPGKVDDHDDSGSGDEEVFTPTLSKLDHQYAAPRKDVPRRIHILGTGSIGKLVAHSLRGLPNSPPITLIFHRFGLLKAWEEGKKEIVIADGDFEVSRRGFDVELVYPARREHGVEMPEDGPSVYDFPEEIRPHEAAKIIAAELNASEPRLSSANDQQAIEPQRQLPGQNAIMTDPIHNLIVTTKAAHTVSALSSVKDRLSPRSTVCFLQNGMGIIDDVNSALFPDPETRPCYIQGIITHGVNIPPGRGDFYAVHAGKGTIALGLLPRNRVQSTTITHSPTDTATPQVSTELWAPSARYLLRTLTRDPILMAVGFAPTELLQQQLEKLAMNSVINPLTVLLDSRNGSILYNFALTRTMRLLLAEISLVITSLPELQGLPNVRHRFSPERLETLIIGIANKTKDNICSMLADVRQGRKTEIEYINGYLVKRGDEMGIKCVVNYAIMQTVIGKRLMIDRERRDEVPVEERREE